MKAHTSDLKNNIKLLGRELSSKITYELNGETIELGGEELNSITPHYKSALLKSTMKQLDIDSNVEIPEGTVINYQEGIKVGNSYEYLNYGNYVVYSVEKQEDTYSYAIKCYDKMLYTMKDYESMEITYPITVRNFINAICNKVGLTFKNVNEQFVNYNKEIPAELYISTEGRSLGYTFRDVLDELAEVTASNICINEEDDELEIRYVKDAGEETETTGSDITITDGEEAELSSFELEGKTTQETRSGINLLNITATTTTQDGITYTIHKDKSITINGTNTKSSTSWLRLAPNFNLPAGTYTLSNGNSNVTYNTFLFYDDKGNIPASGNVSSKTFTSSIEVAPYIRIGGGKTINNQTIYPMIVEGSYTAQTLPTYEPYGAMPSPDYPSELVSVGYENLLNLVDGTYTHYGITGTVSNGIITLNGTATSTAFVYINVSPSLNIPLNETISLSANNPIANNNVRLRIDNDGYLDTILDSTNKTSTINVNRALLGNKFGVRVQSGTTLSNFVIKPQIEKGTQAHNYIPYGKYGIEVKTTGKNLFSGLSYTRTTNGITFIYNDDGSISVNGTANANAYSITTSIASSNGWLKSLKAGTYTLSGGLNDNIVLQILDSDGTALASSGRTSNSFTITSEKQIYIRVYVANGTQVNTTIYPQLEEGTQATTYEEYKLNTYLYTLNQPLRSIGDTKDLLYIKNGMLYVERKIGSIVLNGSEVGWSNQGGQAPYSLIIDNLKRINSQVMVKSSNFMGVSYNSNWTIYNALVSTSTASSSIKLIKFKYVDMATLDNFKSWLSTHNTEVDYILAEPYTEELGQVEMPSTYEGITYIETTDSNEPTMNITYISEFEEIDEEYLNDVNVNFGEKFGPVNTVILSRSGGSDKLAQSMPQDIADEDKIAIEISENQIMNDNNRADFIPEILSKLKGIEYYTNDFISKGICYLNLLDRYRVKVFDNKYKCIMLSDEVNKTQGLEESIYTEKPEETNTEYKHTSTDDRKINQTYIIAKKNEGTIEAVVESVSGEDGLAQRVQRVETKQTTTDLRIDIMGTHIDQTTGDVREVKTSTGFTFDAEGMTIEDSSSNFKSLHRNTGTYYKDGDTIVGQYTKDGSKQKDLELFGVYYYGKNDFPDTPMFVAQLYTDKNGEECFGHFYNRGD